MKNENFTLRQLQDALDALGIEYALSNPSTSPALSFCSLFAPHDNGIYFVEGERLPAELAAVRGAVIVTSRSLALDNACQLIVAAPQVAYYRLMQFFFADTAPPTGIHPSAIVAPTASVDPSAWIGPYCVIGAARIGAGVYLSSHVVVHDGCVLEADVRVEAHSTIGATGVAWVWDSMTGERVVQPQIGSAWIGTGCFIGTDVTVVRGSINEITRLGAHCMVAHGSKIGHGSVVGEHVHFANNVSLAGNVNIGDRVFLSSGCVVQPRVRIAVDVIVGAGAVVVKDIAEPGLVVAGVPAKPLPPKERHTGVPKKRS